MKRNKPMIVEVFSCCNDEVPWVPFKVCWFKVKTWTAKLIMTCQILLKKHNAALIDTIDVPLFAGFLKHVSSIRSGTGCCPIKNSSLIIVTTRIFVLYQNIQQLPLFKLKVGDVWWISPFLLWQGSLLSITWSVFYPNSPSCIKYDPRPTPVVLLQVSFEYLAAAQMMVK